jgi:nucleoside-diphosphate-sugar epimerase
MNMPRMIGRTLIGSPLARSYWHRRTVRTVVVTGASGFLGQQVVARLSGHPDVERVIGIDLVPGVSVDPRVEHVVLDLASDPGAGPDRLTLALEGADSLIHLAWSHGAVGQSDGPSGPAGSANLAAVRRVLDLATALGTTTLVHLSSATVYGAWPDNPVPLPEEAAIRPNPGFTLAAEKAEAERLVAEWAAGHPASSVAVLRPAVTVGSAGPALYQALAGTRSPRPDDSGRPMQFLHVDDLAAAVVLAWERRLTGVYNVAPDGWIGEDAARALAGGVAQLTLPGKLTRAVAAWSWRVWRTGTPKEALAYSIHPWVVANDRLRAAGWVCERSNEEALVSTDDRSHWTDLPPSRRQEVALLAAAGGLVATGAGLVAATAALIGRLRRRR